MRAIYGVYSSPYNLSLFCVHGSMGFQATMYGSQKSHYPWLKCHKNEEKIDNDYVLRNDHRIKTTQPISMIFISFFSEENVLSDDSKICYIFKYWSKENWAFRLGGGGGEGGGRETPGISLSRVWSVTETEFTLKFGFEYLTNTILEITKCLVLLIFCIVVLFTSLYLLFKDWILHHDLK